MKIIPVGCAKARQRALIEHLMQEDEDLLLIDIRFVPGPIAPGWNLLALQERWGTRYRWFGPTLGNRSQAGQPWDIVDLDAGLLELETLLWQDWTLLLMCACQHYQECHRHLIASLLVRSSSEYETVLPQTLLEQGARLGHFQEERRSLEEHLRTSKPTLPHHWSSTDYEQRLFGGPHA